MDIKFPQQRNPFPKTMAVAILQTVIALVIGLFLGNALGSLLGTDDSVINTTTYTDYMSAARSMFTDADQLDSYMNTALELHEMDGLRLYSNKSRTSMMASYQGQFCDASELFDDTLMGSLRELMNTEDALYGMETTGGKPIENLRLFNLAVEDQVVYYYLYYDNYGYIGIAYDHTEEVLSQHKDITLQLTQNNPGDQGMWYILYYLED